MKLVIDIPESEIPKKQSIIEIPLHFIDGKVCEAGGYGFDVLPKGHGELIERDKIEYLKAIHDAKYGHISWSEAIKRIKYSAPTIIEADKEYEVEVITRGNCMMCGKELTEGLFFCKECEAKIKNEDKV